MRSEFEIKVRGYHVDHFDHVNHARYIEFLEEGRWDYFEKNHQLTDYCHKNGVVHAVVNININYRKSATVGDVLRIETEVLKSGNTSVIMIQKVISKKTEILMAEAEVTNVFLDAKSGDTVPLTGAIAGIWPDLGQ
jgi:thioesterase III